MTGRAVVCHFNFDRLDEVMSLIGGNVRVSGFVRYFDDGSPRTIAHVEAIQVLSTAHGKKPRDFWGSIPGLCLAQDSVECLNRAT